jgi:hypothetical protein
MVNSKRQHLLRKNFARKKIKNTPLGHRPTTTLPLVKWPKVDNLEVRLYRLTLAITTQGPIQHDSKE